MYIEIHIHPQLSYTHGEALGPTRAPNIWPTAAAFRLWLAVNMPSILTNAIKFINVRPFSVNLIWKSKFNLFKEPNHKTACISYSVYTLTCFLWFKWIKQKLHNRCIKHLNHTHRNLILHVINIINIQIRYRPCRQAMFSIINKYASH